MVVCDSCREKNPKNAETCASCGEALKEEVRGKQRDVKKDPAPCPDCGTPTGSAAAPCPECGARRRKAPDPAITRGITRPLKPGLGASSAFLFGPFAYLYVRRYDLFGTWLVLGILLGSFFGILLPSFFWVLVLFLWSGWAIHVYSIAKKINAELGA